MKEKLMFESDGVTFVRNGQPTFNDLFKAVAARLAPALARITRSKGTLTKKPTRMTTDLGAECVRCTEPARSRREPMKQFDFDQNWRKRISPHLDKPGVVRALYLGMGL